MSPHFDCRKLTRAAIKAVGGIYGLPLDMAVSFALMRLCSRAASLFTGRPDLP